MSDADPRPDGPSDPTLGGAVPTDDGRYALLSLEGDAVIVYDRERTDAWIQSDVVSTLPAREGSAGDAALGPGDAGGAGND
ncbi:hypothetical protein [Halobaculum sp. EA56]|uniref:hypothetical protein n=1 Tax=Halobaculum sp. EA56 TaxID=3421648 RepID=UPI003EB89FB7